MSGWQAIECENEVHVYPPGDSQEHVLDGPDCHCAPEVERAHNKMVVIHNAYDLREAQEFINKHANERHTMFQKLFIKTFKRKFVFFNMWRSWKMTPVIEFFAVSFGSHRNGIAILNFFVGTDAIESIQERVRKHKDS